MRGGLAMTLFARVMPPRNEDVHSTGLGANSVALLRGDFAEIASDHEVRLTSQDAIDQIL